MVRVGGGWDTLEHFLLKYDPCRTGQTGLNMVGMASILNLHIFFSVNINC